MPLPIKIALQDQPTTFTLTDLDGLPNGNIWVSGALTDPSPSHQFVRISYELVLLTVPESGDRVDFWIARGDNATSNPIWDGSIPTTTSRITSAGGIAAALAALKAPAYHSHPWQSGLGTTIEGSFDFWDHGPSWQLVIYTVGESFAASGNVVRYKYGTPAMEVDSSISVSVKRTGNGTFLRTLQAIYDKSEVTPQDFDAKDDNSADASGPFQNMFNHAAETGAAIRIPRGAYRLDSTVTATYQGSVTNTDSKGFNVRGDGRNVSVIWANHAGNVFHIIGDPAAGSGLHLHSRWSEFAIAGALTRNSTAFRLEACAFFEINDVLGYNLHQMINGTDVLSAVFYRMHMMVCNYGTFFQRVGISRPNAITFYNCIASNCREWAYRLIEPSTVSWFGGSVEGAGKFGVDALRWGIKTENAGGIGGGINIHGVHFEGTHGNADIWHTQGTFPCTYSILGNTLQKTLPSEYPEYNIRFDQGAGAQDIIADIRTNAFKGFNGYVPSINRAAIRVFSTDGNFYINAWPNYFQFPDEIPTFAHNPDLAWGLIDGTQASPIAPIKAHNISDVTRTATGVYSVNFRRPGSSTAKMASVGLHGAGRWEQGTSSANHVQILTFNTSNVAANMMFNIHVRD